MRRFELTLALFCRLVEQLEDAKSQVQSTAPGHRRRTLEAHVRRLTYEYDEALSAVSNAIVAENEWPGEGPGSPDPDRLGDARYSGFLESAQQGSVLLH